MEGEVLVPPSAHKVGTQVADCNENFLPKILAVGLLANWNTPAAKTFQCKDSLAAREYSGRARNRGQHRLEELVGSHGM